MCKFLIAFTYLFLSLSFLAAQPNFQAESDSLQVYWMNEIVVTENRLPVITEAAMHQLSSLEISRLDAVNPSVALQFVPGLHVTKIWKNEMTFKLRGFEQRQISVFLDGVPVSVPYDGSLDLSQLAGDNLDEIRVSRGASSSLYGKNTIGGSVNILTSAFTSAKKLRARIEGSNHNRYFTSINYHNKIKDLLYSINATVEQGADFKLSDDFKTNNNEDGGERDNTAFRKSSFGLKLNYKITANHSLGLNYNRINNNFNIPVDSETSRPRYWQFPDWKKNVLSLTGKHVFSDRFLLRSTLYYDTYFNTLKSYDDDTYSSQDERWAWKTTYDDYSKGLILYPSFKLFNFGSTNMVFAYKNDVHKEEFRDFGFEKFETASWTAGIEQDIKFTENDMAVIGADANYLQALYAEDLALRDPILLYNGQILYQHKFGNNFAMHISVAQETRFPTLKELYSERLGRAIANPDLKEEQSQNNEFGMKYYFDQGYFQFSLFRNNLTNLIVPVELGNETEQMQNVGKARMQGIELDSKISFGNFHLLANYTYMQSENKSADLETTYMEYRPEHRANFFGQWQFQGKMYLALESNYAANQYFQNPSSLEWEKLNDYVLFNLKYNYSVFEFLNWYIRVNNVTDKDYMSEYGVPMPGREIISGLRFAL